MDTETGSTVPPTDSPIPTSTDFPTPDFAQDCLGFDPDDVEIVEDGDRWLVTDGNSRMLLFDEFENAKKARDLIKHYGFTQHCFVGRPDPGMSYWLVDGAPATNRDPPDIERDCLSHDPEDVEIVEDGDRWLITDGNSRMMLFDEFENAKKARDIIKHYGFTQRCFVGRPNPRMDYWLVGS